jgi:hypothetical protein
MNTTERNKQEDNLPVSSNKLRDVMEKVDEEIEATKKEITSISDRIGKVEKDNDERKKLPELDIEQSLKTIQDSIRQISFDIKTQLEKAGRIIKIQLFPEQDRKLFYKIVFGRWFIILAVMLAIRCLYLWGINRNDNQRIVTLKLIEAQKMNKAWDYMYHHADRKTRRMMDSAVIKSSRTEQ